MEDMMTTEQAVGAAYEKPEVPPARKAEVGRWLAILSNAEKHWKGQYELMRDDMAFAAGIQWDGQKSVKSERYVANITNRHVAQKVSALYARDPSFEAEVRQRLEYTLWDGKQESVALAIQSVQAAVLGLGPLDPNAQALIADYTNGTMLKEQYKRIGETLSLVYEWQVDQQEPEFKKQMKQLVRRTVITGVGFVKLHIELPDMPAMTGDGVESTVQTRLQRAQELLREMSEDGATQDDARVEQVQQLLMGLSAGVDSAANGISRLVFGFPASDAIVVDPKCRQLKDFVGADWVAERFRRPKDEVEAFFETRLCAEAYGADSDNVVINEASEPQVKDAPSDETDEQMVTFYEVYNKKTKARFTVAVGHDDYLVAPEPVLPATKRFWPWFTLSFNDVEASPCDPGEDDTKVRTSIYPPSDVTLLRSMQKEWNRSREAAREHRMGSVPFYISTVKLTDADKKRLKAVDTNDVVELEGLPPGTDAGRVLVAFQPATINPLVYETQSIQQDVLMTVGTQEANFGPTSGATATESTIAEQSRISNLSSNADDLDDLLTDLARAGGELLMRVMNEEEVKAIAGPGALWPPYEQVDQFAQEVVLKVKAASSGRPNKALEVANFERMAPWLLQAGANPRFLVEEGVRRLDDRLPVEQAFPLAQPVASPLAEAAPPTAEPRGKPTTKNQLPAPGNV